jgi:hypothetical protein
MSDRLEGALLLVVLPATMRVRPSIIAAALLSNHENPSPICIYAAGESRVAHTLYQLQRIVNVQLGN